MSGRNEEAGKQIVEGITQSGGTASFHPVDVTSHSSIQALHSYAVSTYGRLDAAINNSGIAIGMYLLHDTPSEEFERIYQVNQRGPFWCMQEQIKIMLAQEKKEGELKRGVIVNMSSMTGVLGTAYVSSYAATKHAVLILSLVFVKQITDCICSWWV